MNFLSDKRILKNEIETVKKFMAEVPVRVGELARLLGIDVVKSPLSPKISGLIEPSSESKSGFKIRVNKYESNERQRFTVAHEISHFLLHRHEIMSGVIDNIMYRSQLTSRKEAEANKLAAEIIMPEEIIKRELNKIDKNNNEKINEDFARLFRVSLQAIQIRLEEIKK